MVILLIGWLKVDWMVIFLIGWLFFWLDGYFLVRWLNVDWMVKVQLRLFIYPSLIFAYARVTVRTVSIHRSFDREQTEQRLILLLQLLTRPDVRHRRRSTSTPNTTTTPGSASGRIRGGVWPPAESVATTTAKLFCRRNTFRVVAHCARGVCRRCARAAEHGAIARRHGPALPGRGWEREHANPLAVHQPTVLVGPSADPWSAHRSVDQRVDRFGTFSFVAGMLQIVAFLKYENLKTTRVLVYEIRDSRSIPDR